MGQGAEDAGREALGHRTRRGLAEIGTVQARGLSRHQHVLELSLNLGNGHELVSTFFMAGGGSGEIGQFHVELELLATPPTPNGFVEVWEDNEGYPHEGPYDGPVAEIFKVVGPVVFGTHVVHRFV